MRSLLSLTALVVLIGVAAGCGDSNNNNSMPDLAMTPADMSATPSDMMKYQTCAQILTCAMGCGQNQTCAVSCGTNAIPAAQGRFIMLAGCIVGACGPGDGGSHMCTSAADTSSGCATCIGTVSVGATQAGAPCHAEYAACASN